MEIWKDIPEYEGLYQVSNLGKVKSLCNRKFTYERILQPVATKTGYLRINLCKNKIVKHFSIHRLVAQAFIPNPNNLPQINHKNEDKNNNCVDNLEWCTSKYNINYGTAIKRRIEKTSVPILMIKDNGEKIEYSSLSEASRLLHINISSICECLKGKQKTAGGYKWKYKRDEV